MIRYHARWVLPIAAPPIAHGTVCVEGDRIAWVGARGDAPPGRDEELGDAVLLPGLVNTHTHLELTALRGFLEQLPFRDWLVTLQRAKQEVLDPERMLDAARLGVSEGLLAGVTTFADTCDSGVAIQAMAEQGVRGVMYQEVFGPDPASCATAERGLREKVERHRRRWESDLRRVGVSPHAPYTVCDELFAGVARLATAEGLPVAVHVAESAAEHDYVTTGAGDFAEGLRRRGIAVAPRARSPIALLERTGILDTGPLLIHAVRSDAEDVRLVAAHRCGVAHCPVSNAKLGHGIAPLAEWLAAGIAVGLGSDSVASNNRMSILEEARLAVLLQGARLGDASVVDAAEALRLATLGGARALGLEREIGTLEPGKQADLAAFSLAGVPAVPLYDPAAAVVFALAGHPAHFVAVAGVPRVRDGRLVAEDPELPARVGHTASLLLAWRARRPGRLQPAPAGDR